MSASSLLAEHPLQQREQWQLEDPAAWEWQGVGDATTLVCTVNFLEITASGSLRAPVFVALAGVGGA